MRLKVVDSGIFRFDGTGRSCYICDACLGAPRLEVRIQKLKKITQSKEEIQTRIEELKARWQKK